MVCCLKLNDDSVKSKTHLTSLISKKSSPLVGQAIGKRKIIFRFSGQAAAGFWAAG